MTGHARQRRCYSGRGWIALGVTTVTPTTHHPDLTVPTIEFCSHSILPTPDLPRTRILPDPYREVMAALMSQEDAESVDSGVNSPADSDATHPVDHLRLVVEIDRSTPPTGLLRSGTTEFPFVGWMELLGSIESALAEGA